MGMPLAVTLYSDRADRRWQYGFSFSVIDTFDNVFSILYHLKSLLVSSIVKFWFFHVWQAWSYICLNIRSTFGGQCLTHKLLKDLADSWPLNWKAYTQWFCWPTSENIDSAEIKIPSNQLQCSQVIDFSNFHQRALLQLYSFSRHDHNHEHLGHDVYC